VIKATRHEVAADKTKIRLY